MFKRIFGFNFKIHYSLYIFIGLLVLAYWGQFDQMIMALATITMAFFSVFLHELGHIYAARYFNFKTTRLTLGFWGGAAELEDADFSKNAMHEFVITIAGPAVNLLIGLIAGMVLVFHPTWLFVDANAFSIEAFTVRIAYINLMLVFFNMLPIFPMDGGRIMRSSLFAMTDNHQLSSILTSIMAMIMAIIMIIYSYYSRNIVMGMIMVYVLLTNISSIYKKDFNF